MNKPIIVYFRCYSVDGANDLQDFRIVLKPDSKPVVEIKNTDMLGEMYWMPYCDYMMHADGSVIHDLDILKLVILKLWDENGNILNLGTLCNQ